MKVGTDIIEIQRIERAIGRSEPLKRRLFNKGEIEYCESKGKGAYQSYAAMFSAKEAVMKALGTGLRYGSWRDIEICHDEWGAPFVVLTGTFKRIFTDSGLKSIHISLSHCRDYAMCTVIMEA